MADRYPDYDVLAKSDTLSWNPVTRKVIAERMATAEPDILSPEQHATLRRLIERIVPQPDNRPPVNTVALLLHRIMANRPDGYRHHRLPPLREAWTIGLAAIDAEAQARHGQPFALLSNREADDLLRAIEASETQAEAWQDFPPALFWSWRLIPDIVSAYYAHPSAWSAMGFGGPASPRGYVRLLANRRDPWEAREEGNHHGA
ncbi:gluconate 2-dehydrogenase subunit 3 family protein [Sphingomonas oligoaromativorans]|uniref:gluconate 2-dehydrogenase subunit 3 family protein n=1 Tax=Sphingomonas oligoaromativorans TaxID=575322 RepID=UPI0014240070|nr:gluconate 2-dehydrogenase subunit 3 family protein [Sphingomonas oligoaromativorans]NIJ33371.1 hypothetical protein [Sphingomonas oligoaromativorans]